MKSLLQLRTTLALLAIAQVVNAQPLPLIIQQQDDLTLFGTYLGQTNLNPLLFSGDYSVFAPTNEAFGVLDPKYSEPEWAAHLTEILLQHIVRMSEPYVTEAWTEGFALQPFAGVELVVTVAQDPNYQLNNVSNIVTPNITADNGVVHAMDTVILPPSARDDFIDLINLPIFSILNSLLDQAGLTETLANEGPFTFFAPTDEAFEALGPDVLANLQADTDALSNVLLYHVVPGIFLSETLANEDVSQLPTLQGSDLVVPFEGLTEGDFLVSNGILRVISQVQIPPSDGGGGDGGVDETFNGTVATGAPTDGGELNGTVATGAPTDGGELVPIGTYDELDWAELPANVQEAGIVLGYNESIWNDGLLAETDDFDWAELSPEQQAAAAVFGYDEELWDSEGAVVIPPADAYTDSGQNSIIDIAIGANFTIMLFALNQTVWLDNLQNDEGPYTLFAVPNDGFDSLSPKFYTDPQWNTHLTNILTYNILSREWLSGSWEVGSLEATVNQNPINVTSIDPYAINDINITTTNITASNGIIHIIEEMLLPPSATDSALELLVTFDQFSILNELVNLVNLTEALDGEGPITLAAPQNSAFEALPEGTLDSLRADPEALTDILLYHVVPELVDFASTPANGASFTTLQGSSVTYASGDTNKIGEAEVLLSDLLVSNGYFHLIEQVLIPPSATETAAPTDIVTAVTTTVSPTEGIATVVPTEMATTVSPTEGATTLTPTEGVTTVSPTEGATTLIPTEGVTTVSPTEGATTLTPTEGVTTVSPTVGATTLTPTEGVITASPTSAATAAATTTSPTAPATSVATVSPTSTATVVVTSAPTATPADTASPTTGLVTAAEAVRSNPDYSTLFTLLEQADLVDTIETLDPITLFAPTNAAFDKLPEGTVESLDAESLSNILAYHVIASLVLSTDLVDGAEVEMAQGSNATVSLNPARINDATILAADILVSNGVIHEIDTVLIPPAPETVTPTEPTAETTPPTEAVVETAAPTEASAETAAPTEAVVEPSGPPVVTVAPSDENCVNVPGVQVCCPPGQTEGVFFFCRFL